MRYVCPFSPSLNCTVGVCQTDHFSCLRSRSCEKHHPLCSTNLGVFERSGPKLTAEQELSRILGRTPRCVTKGDWELTVYVVCRYVVGGIEGRCAVGYFDPSLSGENFAFKCHRDSDHAFAVNSVDFHPKHNSFATAGSDGTFVYWDKDSKSRLKAFSRIPTRGAITCGRFSADGSMFAYAQSYDWAKVRHTLLPDCLTSSSQSPVGSKPRDGSGCV